MQAEAVYVSPLGVMEGTNAWFAARSPTTPACRSGDSGHVDRSDGRCWTTGVRPGTRRRTIVSECTATNCRVDGRQGDTQPRSAEDRLAALICPYATPGPATDPQYAPFPNKRAAQSAGTRRGRYHRACQRPAAGAHESSWQCDRC